VSGEAAEETLEETRGTGVPREGRRYKPRLLIREVEELQVGSSWGIHRQK